MKRSRSRVLAARRSADIASDRAEWEQSFSVIPDFDFSLPDSWKPEEESKEGETILLDGQIAAEKAEQ